MEFDMSKLKSRVSNNYDDEIETITCPSCNAQIKKEAIFCTECGSKIDDISLVEQIFCPSCHQKINANSQFCTNCGFKIPVETYDFKCPTCSHKINTSMNYCIYCGTNIITMDEFEKLESKFSTNHLKIKCPNCGIMSDGPICATCGTRYVNNYKFEYCSDCVTKQKPIYSKKSNTGFITKDEATCEFCGKPLKKSLNDMTYLKIYNDRFLKSIKKYSSYDLDNNELFEELGLTKEQAKHIESTIMKDLIFNKITEKEIVPKMEELKQIIIDNDENIENYILDIAKSYLKHEFINNGFSSFISQGGEEKVKIVSEGRYESVQVPVIQRKHGAGTRALATFGFGLIGYAVTSGVKQTYTTQTRYKPPVYSKERTPLISTYINLNDKYVVYDITEEDKKPIKRKISWEDVIEFKNKELILKDSTTISEVYLPPTDKLLRRAIVNAIGFYDWKFNEKICSKYDSSKNNNILKKYCIELINDKIDESKKEIKQLFSSPADELRKYAELYKEGFLTEEEFQMKKKELL